MARVTIDDCLQRIDNRFALVITAAKRSRQIHQGARALVKCKNKEVVTSLREVSAGLIEAHVPGPAGIGRPSEVD